MQFLQLLSIVATTVATVAIAIFSYRTYQVYASMEKIMSRNLTETKDLYQAIVVATLLTAKTGPGEIDGTLKLFKHFYKGETKLFTED